MNAKPNISMAESLKNSLIGSFFAYFTMAKPIDTNRRQPAAKP